MINTLIMKYCSLLFLGISFGTSVQAQEKPNILWLTSEDHGPRMGCYGFMGGSYRIGRYGKKGSTSARYGKQN